MRFQQKQAGLFTAGLQWCLHLPASEVLSSRCPADAGANEQFVFLIWGVNNAGF